MKETCFYTIYDNNFKSLGDGCVNSIKRFYPDIDVLVYTSPEKEGKWDLYNLCWECANRGRELLEKYKRVIYIDADSIMCAPCPDLFGDFDMGVVQNNIPVDDRYGGDSSGVYINNGLAVCTSKEAWEEYTNEFRRRNNENWGSLNQQNALNWVFHNSKLNIKLLEFSDRVYGNSVGENYANMYLNDGELYVDEVWNHTNSPKKICIFHAAGINWKNKETGEIYYNLFKNQDAAEKLRSYTL